MTDKIQQARRAVFEAWASEPPFEFCLDRYDGDGTWPGNYRNYSVECAWEGFNAALDCVVIELPQLIGLNESFQGTPISEMRAQNHYNQAVSKCRAAIESTNLGIKVK